MSNVHYFQRYSSKENTVTNNTLQLIHRIYEHSIIKLNAFLQELLDEGVQVGLEISQQDRGENSVPDGRIIQRGFKIVLEAKVNAGLNEGQLLRHMKKLQAEDGTTKILLLLTKESLTKQQTASLAEKVQAQNIDVRFFSITYKNICDKLEGLFQEFETPIFEIAEDYIAYCRDMGLMDNIETIMRVVPTGTSFDLNKKYGIYFQPSDRGYSRHTYIGFYKDKAVRAIGKVVSVFDVTYEAGKLERTLVLGENTDRFDEAIKQMIPDAKETCGYDVRKGHHFFCMDEVAETDFVKDSPYGIQGARFFDLSDYVEKVNDVKTIANSLRDKSWEHDKMPQEASV